MGRGKIEIKRIENSSNRQVTYSKRRNGIIKKAKEITVLCDAQVSLVIIAGSGKVHDYCSPSTTLSEILGSYQKDSGKRLWDAKHENLSNEIERIKKENESMQIHLRHLDGEDITSLHFKELMAIEADLERGHSNVRDKLMELRDMRSKSYEIAEEQNKYLNYTLSQQLREETSGRGFENGYHQGGGGGVRDYDQQQQMPFVAYRVQPMQPNLHQRI